MRSATGKVADTAAGDNVKGQEVIAMYEFRNEREREFYHKFFVRLARVTGVSAQQLRAQLLSHVVEEVESAVRERAADEIEAVKQSYAAHIPGDPDRRGWFRLPMTPKSPIYHSLERVLCRTGMLSGCSSYWCAMVMSQFLEAIAYEVSKGHPVRIPGFGLFTPYAYEREGHAAYAQVRFVAARSLRGQVRRLCPLTAARQAVDRADHYRRAHHPSSRTDRDADCVYASMEWFRRIVRSTGGELATSPLNDAIAGGLQLAGVRLRKQR